MTPTFAISMLALDGLEMTKRCVDSILKGGGEFRLILTDNGSNDGTAQYFTDIAATHKNVYIRSPGENTGFIVPNNAAFEMARTWGIDYFVTVNNDLVVPTGWLDKIAATFALHPKAAIVGPQGTISHLSPRMLGFSRAKLDYIEGSLMAVKVGLVRGELFSPYLDFIYHEDSDLGLRMQRAGYTIHQADFRVEHHNGSTCTRHPAAILRCKNANARNQRVMLEKWGHWNRVRSFDFPILVRRRFAVGDVLLATPIIKALHELWPLCPIDVETRSPDIFYKNPYVRKAADRINPAPNTMMVNLDMVYERTPGVHVLESYARAAGVHPLTAPRLELYTDHPVPDVMRDGRWCAVHVGPTTWAAKNWPNDRWCNVIDWLRGDGWKILLLGDVGDRRMNYDLDLRGQKGIQEMAGALQACQLFIGLDSFPAHAAAALEIPCVVLYGITNPDCFKVATAPYITVRSDPRHPNTGRRNKIPGITMLQAKDDVMQTISVDQVKSAIAEITKDVLV